MGSRLVTARRVWIALGCLAAVVLGIALAYWQWTRYESASGTLQNLGYVLQWPLFGFFPLFLVWRIYRYSRTEAARENTTAGDATPEHTVAGNTAPLAHADLADTEPDVVPESASSAAAASADEQPSARRRSRMAYVPPTVADQPAEDDDDPALARYNALLAQLAAEDGESTGHAGSADRPDATEDRGEPDHAIRPDHRSASTTDSSMKERA